MTCNKPPTTAGCPSSDPIQSMININEDNIKKTNDIIMMNKPQVQSVVVEIKMGTISLQSAHYIPILPGPHWFGQ